jgi:hypothetical protein
MVPYEKSERITTYKKDEGRYEIHKQFVEANLARNSIIIRHPTEDLSLKKSSP